MVHRCPPCIEKKLKANWEAQRGHPLKPVPLLHGCGKTRLQDDAHRERTMTYRCQPCYRKYRYGTQPGTGNASADSSYPKRASAFA